MLQAPGQCPLGHRYACWYFLTLNLLHLCQSLVPLLHVMLMTDIIFTKGRSRLIFTT
ncbi:hypothetical protein D1872_280680 [compost metagenome]